jgi:hypothetical protein
MGRLGVGSPVAARVLAPSALLASRYRVGELLGRGASSEVYAVVDERTGAALALKRVVAAPGQEAGPIAQLEREFYTLCELAHPSIIAVHDYVSDGAHAFYTMELLDGRDLASRGEPGSDDERPDTPSGHSQRPQRPFREVCEILRDIASSLAIVHSRRLLHRDLSARNVCRTRDGRAKLIDFGALMPMGVSKRVIGTPPFVPPEALQLQALDARADLYGLGALAYYLLTGRHAYRAHTFDQLADLWRSPVTPVRTLAPETPPALEQLVHDLLSLDRAARPSSAAEVMERICNIAQLPLRERAEVSHAYLTTPTLVGRAAQLDSARAALLQLRRGHSASLVITGEEGTGRSRFLDACVLEAKLLGAVVLRADTADGSAQRDTARAIEQDSASNQELGVAKALCARLFAAAPELAHAHARPHRARLSHLIEALGGDVSERAAPSTPLSAEDEAAQAQLERRRVHAALRDFWLSISRALPIAIAIDDFDAIDEPSAAWLGALASSLGSAPRGAQRSLVLMLAIDSDAHSSTALDLVREVSQTLVLEPLVPVQTEALLRVLFGDVDHLPALAARIHEVSEGNPRTTMALAERLVERGLARYEAGAWTLPAELAAGDLPDSLAAAFEQRVSALPEDARELAEVLALTDASSVPVERYAALCSHGDAARAYRALDTLVAAKVLAPSGTRYRFGQRELAALLERGLDEETRCAMHERLARLFESLDEPVLLPYHLWFSGAELTAVEMLRAARHDARIGFPRRVLELLERVLDAGVRLGLSANVRGQLSLWITDIAATRGDSDQLRRFGDPLLELLERESGIADYHALSMEGVPASERLMRALTRAQARYDQAPHDVRGFPPSEAISMLARVCAIYGGIASSLSQDRDLFDRLPSLDPLVGLSPALAVVRNLIATLTDFQSGRFDDAAAKSLVTIERVSQPDHAQLEPRVQRAIYLGQLYMQSVIMAATGNPSTPAWLGHLEQDAGHRVNAWRVRMTYELMQGDLDGARISQRTADLLLLQDGGEVMYPGSTTRIELIAYSSMGDLLGIKRLMARVEELAKRFPRMRPLGAVARSRYLALQGDFEGALEVLRPHLDLKAGRHIDWTMVMGQHLVALLGLGRAQEVVDLGLQYIEECKRERLTPSHRALMRTTSEAMLAVGRSAEAFQLATWVVEEADAIGVRGVTLALNYECLAHAAIEVGDAAAFARAVERMEADSKHVAALRQRYERLLRVAAERGMQVEPDALHAEAPRQEDPKLTVLQHALAASRSDVAVRAAIVLRALLDATGAEAGDLFGLQGGALQVLAHSTPEPPSQAVRSFVEAHLSAVLYEGQAPTRSVTTGLFMPNSAEQRSVLGPASTLQASEIETIVLGTKRDGDEAVAAIAALRYGSGARHARKSPSRALVEALADALLEGEIDPVTRVA